MSRRKPQRMTVASLSHDEAVQYLVEYHFGRLSPAMNAAVEAHIRTCRICQRQGLSHAATEKRDIARQMKRIRPGNRRISHRGRNFIVLLALVAIGQLAVYALTRPQGILPATIFGSLSRGAPPAVTPTAGTLPIPETKSVLGAASRGMVALSVSPDGKTIAGAMKQGSSQVIVLWSATGGTARTTLTWSGSAVPGAIAWSPDGDKLAATDGTTIGVWDLPTTVPTWTAAAPTAPALSTFGTQAGSPVRSVSTSGAFANGTFLLWGSDGQLTSAPAGAAGPSGIVTPGAPLIGLWQSTGSHVYADGHGSAFVGISDADVSRHVSLLAWSPDGQYVLWGAVSQHVMLDGASGGIAPPNPVIAADAQAVAQTKNGDALVWFSPDGRTLAECKRTTPGAALRIYDIASGKALAALPDACDQLTISSLAWVGSGGDFALALPGQPITLFDARATAGG